MLKRIVIALEPEDQVWLERAVLDEEEKEALRFLKERNDKGRFFESGEGKDGLRV